MGAESAGREGGRATSEPRGRSLALLAEPLVSSDAVQYKFVSAAARALSEWFDVTVVSTYVAPSARAALSTIAVTVLAPEEDRYGANRLLGRFGRRSEATMWAEAWLREALRGSNRKLLGRLVSGRRFDFVVNTTNTAVVSSDVWWIQGPPVHVTLESMVQAPGRDSVSKRILRRTLEVLDARMTTRLYAASRSRVAASKYVQEYYDGQGFATQGVIYNMCDLSPFRPVSKPNGHRYVLAYVGKETELDTLFRVAAQKIPIVAFGGKLVPGLATSRLKETVDFRGRVDQDDLITLYSQAEFTLFPFSNEPLGYVPLESMACGTPVLTYGRQGPAETVVNGETGWLVADAESFVHQAHTLWMGFDRDRFSRGAVERAAEFEPKSQARRLASILLGPPGRAGTSPTVGPV